MRPDRTRGPGRRGKPTRILAGAGAVLAAWVAVDGARSSPVRDAGGGGFDFLLYWVLPFAVAAAFLGWYSLRGGTSAAVKRAKGGCLGGLAFGGGVFLLYATSPLLLPWDPLTGAVHAFLYAPLAGAAGLLIGASAAYVGQRRR